MIKFKNILLIRLGGIGDIAFTLPAVNMIRENYPNSHLTFLTYKEHESLISGFTAVNEVITIDRKIYHQKNLKKIWEHIHSLSRHLHEYKYELVVDFQGFGETAVISWFSHAKYRLGFPPENILKKLYTYSIEEFSTLHRIDKNRELLTKNGILKTPINNNFILPEKELLKAQILLKEFNIDSSKPLIFIQPFTNKLKKNWQLENFLTFGKYWEKRGFQIIFGGGPSDLPKLTSIAAQFPVTAGKASLLTTIGIMKLSTLVVGGDTGLLHFGVAIGKKVLMLMGPTNPKTYGPYGHPEWAIRFNSRNILDIKVEHAIELAEKLINL